MQSFSRAWNQTNIFPRLTLDAHLLSRTWHRTFFLPPRSATDAIFFRFRTETKRKISEAYQEIHLTNRNWILIGTLYFSWFYLKFASQTFVSIAFLADFLPVFKLLDLATGQITQFLGKYGLKIVGGGPTYQSIADYTEEEQIKYNYQTTR